LQSCLKTVDSGTKGLLLSISLLSLFSFYVLATKSNDRKLALLAKDMLKGKYEKAPEPIAGYLHALIKLFDAAVPEPSS
jgi:hypothetical protein